MALPTSRNPPRSEIKAEFGTATLNAYVTQGSLKDMYTHIFQDSTKHNRSDFKGYGKPVISSLSSSQSSALGGKIDVSFTIDQINNPSGFTWNRTNVQVQVSEEWDDLQPTGWQDAGTSQVFSSTGAKSITGVDVPNENTTYAVRILYWNYFNNVAGDELQEPFQQLYPTATSSGPLVFTTPFITKATVTAEDALNFTVTWNYGADPSTFSAQYRIDGGTWQNAGSLINSSNWDTATNPKSATWGFQNLLTGSESSVEVRIRADAESPYDASSWSAAELITRDAAEPTNLHLTQPVATSGSLTASWANQESGTTHIQWQTWNGSSWVDDGAEVSVSTSSNSTTRTYADGEQVRFKAYHTTSFYGNTLISDVVTSADLIVDIQAATTFPENFSAVDNRPFDVQLSWNHPDSGQPDSYNIQSYDGSVFNVVVTGLSGSNTGYTHTTSDSSIIKYRIQALDGGVASSWVESNTI